MVFFKSLLIADPAPATSSTSARFSLGQVTAGGVFKVCYCASLDACNSLEAFNHQAGQLEVLDPLSDLSLFSSTVASITVQVQSRLQGMASRIRCAISEYEPSFMPNGADIANGRGPPKRDLTCILQDAQARLERDAVDVQPVDCTALPGMPAFKRCSGSWGNSSPTATQPPLCFIAECFP
ncbi:unnamed protein product [Effrenium voratum]|nr:unnamed protein product [Effrenium voratum]